MTNPIEKLQGFGQSIWYDNIQRGMLESGEVEALIQRGDIRGMTSNPSIFQAAISAGHESYAAVINTMSWAGSNAESILEQLIVEDIHLACQVFAPLHHQSNGRDGFVSVEVNPRLATETVGTLAEAKRLWERINQPNLMIKIPATLEGLPAIRQAIAAGINVNITLIFSIGRYKQVMNAYLEGLEERLQAGLPVHTIASVASFFVSRMDTKVDRALENIMRQEGEDAALARSLLGKAAIANARLAYAEFRSVFGSPRFTRMKSFGAQLQRPLWASTSTKNPAYPDTLYVDELIGPDTVNTIPPHTLDVFRDHGKGQLTLEKDVDGAREVFRKLEALGISVEKVTDELEAEGVKAFANSFDILLDTVEGHRKEAVRSLGELAGAISERVHYLDQERFSQRLWEHDPSLWTSDPKGQALIRNRMGWLDLPSSSRVMLTELGAFREEILSEGYTHVLLLGMGGSSLAPEVMRLIFGFQTEGLDLAILDSTDQAQVGAAARRAPVTRTLYIVSSKSGGTAEVNAFLDYFWDRATRAVGGRAHEHFVAITDPGTSLEKVARERNFRRVFLADPSVGGRYSALSSFGLVAGALMGLDLSCLLERAAWMAGECAPDIASVRNPGLVLGAIIGEAALRGREKLTLIADPEFAPFGAWVEQLVAESSGKQGKGIVPIVDELPMSPAQYGQDRLFVYLRTTGQYDRWIERLQLAGHPVIAYAMKDGYDLGAEFFRWGVAISTACAILGVNAFDQPDVQDNKDRTVAKIEAYRQDGRLAEDKPDWKGEGLRVYGIKASGVFPGSLREILRSYLSQGERGDYIAINAYLPRNKRTASMLGKLRIAVQKQTKLATTLGFGPRFLHSTGQLHKGGGKNVLFIQVTADPVYDLEIPKEAMTFGILERAQALGDYEALQARGQRVLRVHLPGPNELKKLLSALNG